MTIGFFPIQILIFRRMLRTESQNSPMLIFRACANCGAQDVSSSTRTLKVQLWNKVGADCLCSELSESCVIHTLEMFVSLQGN